MTDLERTVRKAQRRLWVLRWWRLLGWAAAIAGGLYLLAILPNKLFALADDAVYTRLAAQIAAGVALVGSAVWLIITRENRTAAAIQLDLAAGLKERLSTGLYCSTQNDPFAQAVHEDAIRISASITPRQHLRMRFPRSGGYALGIVAFATLVTFLVPPMDLLGKQQERQEQIAQLTAVKKEKERVRRAIAERIEEKVDNKALLDELNMTANLDALTDAEAKTPEDIRTEAVKKLESLTEQVRDEKLAARQAELSNMKKMLRRASERSPNDDPLTRELNDAMAAGDFEKMAETLQKMQEKLAESARTEEEKQQAEQLAKQIDELAQRLGKAAEAQKMDKETADNLEKAGVDAKQVQDQLAKMDKEQLEKIAQQMEKSGASKEQVQQTMQKLQQQQQACKACKQMSNGLAKMASSSSGGSANQSGDQQGAAAGMRALNEQLNDMERMEQDVQSLQQTLAQLEDLKDQIGQPGGTEQGQNDGSIPGRGQGQRSGGMGPLGVGEGGIAPKANDTTVHFKPEYEKPNTEPGAIVGQSWVDGEQYKGEVDRDFREVSIAAKDGYAERLEKGLIPRQYQKTLGRYFQRVVPEAEGQTPPAETNADAPEQP